jgi:hypothetical protein
MVYFVDLAVSQLLFLQVMKNTIMKGFINCEKQRF